jgi:SAM-dependent methyltransferase
VVIRESQSWERVRPHRLRRPHRRPVESEYQSLETAELYDLRRFASPRGRYNNWRLRRLLNRIVRDLPSRSIVLDVPCGTGRIDGWLLKASLHVIGADVSGEMLAVAQRKFRATPSRPALIKANAQKLPFRSRSIDVVCSIRFLHLVEPPERWTILQEMARVATRWIVVEYRNIDRPIQAARLTMTRWLTGEDVWKPKTVSDIVDELTRCGLIAEHYYFMSRWFSGSVLIVARPHELDERREDPPTRAGRADLSQM